MEGLPLYNIRPNERGGGEEPSFRASTSILYLFFASSCNAYVKIQDRGGENAIVILIYKRKKNIRILYPEISFSFRAYHQKWVSLSHEYVQERKKLKSRISPRKYRVFLPPSHSLVLATYCNFVV